jgi:chromosome partitioning protein
MNVITVASRKGGAGKTTLTAHLAALAQRQGHRCLVIDADPQGSLSLCNSLRSGQALPLVTAERGIERPLVLAAVENYDYVFIDTSPTMWVVVQEAIRAATLVVIPARPGFLDLAAVSETVKTASDRNKPYAVVLNACPVKRGTKEAPAVTQSRAYLDKHGIPVWSGQISHRNGFVLSLASGISAGESSTEAAAATEISRLWTAIERSVEAINSAHADVGAIAGQAA